MKYLLRKRVALFFVVTSLGIFFSFTSETGGRYYEIAKNLEILSSVYSEVNRYYVDEVDPTKVMKTGIDAMLNSLDPYTTYIPEDAIEDFRFISTGEYGGIGAIIGNRQGKITVIMPYEGFPAHQAGLQIGDEIVSIGDQVVEGKTSTDISKLLKGQADTDIAIKVKRYGVDDLLPMTLTRKKITVDNVPYKGMVTDEVGYFKLTSFTTNAAKEIKEAVKELQKQGAKKYIFDLRGNTGGLLNEAIDISNLFIEKGREVVSTRGKDKNWTKPYYANNQALDLESPLVVLVNGRSASASEIVSGVIQDYDRGVLIGKNTFGKGLVQATMPIVFNSQVKVTTAKYYIPSGRCIQAIDYGNRDESGKANKVPDSLLTAFKTANGRLVYDGAGIAPDILMEDQFYSDLMFALVEQDVLFDYATEYHFNHKEIPAAKGFQLSDSEFDEFVLWLKKKSFQYKIGVEQELEDVVKAAEADSTFVLDFSQELAAFQSKIDAYKKTDIEKNKVIIKQMLSEEIVSRYYLEKGVVENSFMYDQDIQEALNVLGDTDRYNKILAKH